jgi:hypothetical protein
VTYIDTHAADRSVRWVHLFELAFSSTLRWTDDVAAVAWDGHVWVPYVVAVESVSTEQGQIAGASLAIGNADNALGAYLFAGDVTGAVVKVWQAWLDPAVPGQVPQEVRQVFLGRVSAPQLSRVGNESMVRLTLGPYANPATKLLPSRTVADVLRS